MRSEHVTRGDHVQWYRDNSSNSQPVVCKYSMLKATDGEELYSPAEIDQIGERLRTSNTDAAQNAVFEDLKCL